jgi:hypothetical protein
VAEVNFDGLNLRVTLTRPERCAALRGDLVVPRAQIASVSYAPVIWDRMQHGITPMGVGYRGMVMVGAAWTPAGHDFCVLGRGGPGLEVRLRANKYDRLLLSLPDGQLWPLFHRLREVTGRSTSDT